MRADRVVEGRDKKTTLLNHLSSHKVNLGLEDGEKAKRIESIIDVIEEEKRKAEKDESAYPTKNQSANDTLPSALESTLSSLSICARTPVTKETSSNLSKQYYQIFASCSLQGDWVGSLRTYSSYVSRGFVPTAFVFQNIISACKNAVPTEIDRAILVLGEMRKQGVRPDVRHYNAVIDCCKMGGAWRRAADLFSKMGREEGIEPNTNTYDLMSSLGLGATVKDSPEEIYSTLKFAGVPEYIAYTSACRLALSESDRAILEEQGLLDDSFLDSLEFKPRSLLERRKKLLLEKRQEMVREVPKDEFGRSVRKMRKLQRAREQKMKLEKETMELHEKARTFVKRGEWELKEKERQKSRKERGERGGESKEEEKEEEKVKKFREREEEKGR